MSHVHAFGDQIHVSHYTIHLFQTSLYVINNSDALKMCRTLHVIIPSILAAVGNIAVLARDYGFCVTFSITNI